MWSRAMYRLGLVLGAIMVLVNLWVPTSVSYASVCTGFESGLFTGATGQITAEGGLNLHSQPSANAQLVLHMDKNQSVIVVGDAQCVGAVTWWHVLYKSLIGWAVEGSNNQRYLAAAARGERPRTPPGTLNGTLNPSQVNERQCQASASPYLLYVQRAADGTSLEQQFDQPNTTVDVTMFSGWPSPSLCATGLQDMQLVSPNGTVLALEVTGPNFDDSFEGRLPLWVLSQPGLWTMRAGDFSINLNIVPPTAPELTYRYFSDDHREYTLGGYAPNEMLQIVLGTSNGSEILDVSGLRVTTDANGYYTDRLSTNQDIVLIVRAAGDMVLPPTFSDLGTPNNFGDIEAFKTIIQTAFADTVSVDNTNNAPIVWQGPRVMSINWQQYRYVFHGSGATLYAIDDAGVLWWFSHDGYQSGADQWRGPIQVGTGWAYFSQVFSGDDGAIYAVQTDGSLWWYRHDGYQTGETAWQGPQSVGTGWNQFKYLFAGPQGVIYAVANDGTLYWYQHLGYQTGAATWQGPQKVGIGWQPFIHLFAAENNVIMGGLPNGRLLWYRHLGQANGSFVWFEPIAIEVGAGWQAFKYVFAGPANSIYSIAEDGTMRWYRLDKVSAP